MPILEKTAYNPITGVFGQGFRAVYVGVTAASGAQTNTTVTWVVPAGVGSIRARCWGGGGGGGSGGAGGGFALREINSLSGVTSITLSLGFGGNGTTTTGGTTSVGSYVSATGGTTTTGGTGVGGDINFSGGNSGSTRGGGAASIFGPGGTGSVDFVGSAGFGGAGGGSGQIFGGSGFFGTPSAISTGSVAAVPVSRPEVGFPIFSIDFIGTGFGGSSAGMGFNGGGAISYPGGTPGGGGSLGGPGMIILEW